MNSEYGVYSKFGYPIGEDNLKKRVTTIICRGVVMQFENNKTQEGKV